jgi:hypothetical protein
VSEEQIERGLTGGGTWEGSGEISEPRRIVNMQAVVLFVRIGGLTRDFDFYLKNLKTVLSEHGTGKRM